MNDFLMKWINNSNNRSKIFTAEIDSLKISIVYNHICYPGEWVMHCYPFFDTKLLKSLTVEDAEREAIDMIRAVLESALKELN